MDTPARPLDSQDIIKEAESSGWICPECQNENGAYNAYCEFCKYEKNKLVYNPDKYYIREIRIRHIVEPRGKAMTPQEELFAEFFQKHALIVKDMSILELREYREKLARVAFEAKAAVYAADSAEKELKKQKKTSGPSGFERSLEQDGAATDAINTIKDRQKRISKLDRIQAGLEKLGITSTDATKLMSAGAILGRLKSKASEQAAPEPSKPIFNPFEKKDKE